MERQTVFPVFLEQQNNPNCKTVYDDGNITINIVAIVTN